MSKHIEIINGIPTAVNDKPIGSIRVQYSTPVTLTENITWDGTDLKWEGLKISISGLSASRNAIADQTSNSPGLTNIADGEAIYVTPHFDSGSNDTLTVTKATKSSLTSTSDKFIIAERFGSNIVVGPEHDTRVLGVPT